MKRVYIAGPYSKGDVMLNIRAAIVAGSELADMGFAPFIPHLTGLWHIVDPRPYDFWLDQDKEWLRVCDLLLRLPGESSGADSEVALAKTLGIPVYYDMADLVSHETV